MSVGPQLLVDFAPGPGVRNPIERSLACARRAMTDSALIRGWHGRRSTSTRRQRDLAAASLGRRRAPSGREPGCGPLVGTGADATELVALRARLPARARRRGLTDRRRLGHRGRLERAER